MKQMWQADDGTIFDSEIACEKYEGKLEYRKQLELLVSELSSLDEKLTKGN